MVMGVVGFGSLFAVSGAVVGSAVGLLTARPAKAAAEATKA